ncbi:MAG: DUF1116 domain-containing protein, partial [Terrimesophilobacter sp.]
MTVLEGDARIINVGLPLIVEGVRAEDVIQLDWRPPAFGDADVARLALALEGETTSEANRRAITAVQSVRPQLTRIRPAKEVVPGIADGRTLLHAGPPIEWERMCGPMRGALIGATLFEGWAESPEQAESLLDKGQITVDPCHHHGAVGPMAGVLAPSMPVFVATDQSDGRLAFSSLNEGLGKVLRFGAFDNEV